MIIKKSRTIQVQTTLSMENTGKTSIIYQEYWFSSVLMIILVHNFNPVFLRKLVEPVPVPESTIFPKGS